MFTLKTGNISNFIFCFPVKCTTTVKKAYETVGRFLSLCRVFSLVSEQGNSVLLQQLLSNESASIAYRAHIRNKPFYVECYKTTLQSIPPSLDCFNPTHDLLSMVFPSPTSSCRNFNTLCRGKPDLLTPGPRRSVPFVDRKVTCLY